MKLSELLYESSVLTGFRAKDKTEAIERLVDALAAGGRVQPPQRKAVVDALLSRENIASTGMEHGIAIPHATVDVLDDAVGALGISPEGIPFQSTDGLPSRLIVLLVIPRKIIHRHIQTIAGVARLFSYDDLRDAILRATSAGEILRLIKSEEEREGGGN